VSAAWIVVLPPGQMAPPPLTTAVGSVKFVTVFVHVELQPLALVRLSVRMNVPDEPALTLAEAALVGPLRVALPLTDQR
jgi:hypothetical protein